MEGLRGVGTVLMACLFALFTIVGLVMLFVGRPQDRIAGLACVLLFGLGGVAYITSRRRKADVALRVDTLTWEGRVTRALILPVRRAKWLTTMVGAFGMGTAMVLIGVFAPTFTDPGDSAAVTRFIGYGGGAFFLGLGLAGLLKLRQGPPRLALLPEGVAMIGGVAASYIPWDAVADVGRFDMVIRGTGQRFAGIRATNPEAVRRPASSRVLMAGNRTFSGWDLTFAESMHDVSVEELVALLWSFWQRPQLRRVAESLPDGPMSYEQFAGAHIGDMAAPGGAAGTLPA